MNTTYKCNCCAKDEICLRNAKISEQETVIRVLGELVGRR